MKIDVTHEALLRALVEALREEHDHGRALMSLVSRLVDEAGKQDWFETYRKTDARLKLAQMACGDTPKGWQAAALVLDFIAEAAEWALKADEIDSEVRATFLAITRLADVERSAQAAAQPKRRPVAKSARRTKAVGSGHTRRGRSVVRLAEAKGSRQSGPEPKPRPAASPTRTKANGSPHARRGRPIAALAKPTASPQSASGVETRSAAKPARTRKANGSGPAGRVRAIARLARTKGPRQSAPEPKPRPSATPARTRKTNGAGRARRARKRDVSAPARVREEARS